MSAIVARLRQNWVSLTAFLAIFGVLSYWAWQAPSPNHWIAPALWAAAAVSVVVQTLRGRTQPVSLGKFFTIFMCVIGVIFLVAFVWAMWLLASGQVGGAIPPTR